MIINHSLETLVLGFFIINLAILPVGLALTKGVATVKMKLAVFLTYFCFSNLWLPAVILHLYLIKQ